MISFPELLSYIIAQTPCKAKTRFTPVGQSLGRFLCQNLHTLMESPATDNSAMDGYAICSQGLIYNKALKVEQTCAAGEPKKTILPNEVARIYTGAVLPAGADAVVPQEEVEQLGNVVNFIAPVKPWQHVRRAGEEFKRGELLLSAGEKINLSAYALLHHAGIQEIETFEPLKIVLLSTGDELIEPGETWTPGKIYNSNKPYIASVLRQWGFEVIYTEQVADTLQATTNALKKAAEFCDVILSIGGASVGEKDFMKQAIKQLGTLDFWRVNMKPGKPLILGKIGQTDYIGLPGNPTSAALVLLLLGRPQLMRTQGANLEHVTINPLRVKSAFQHQTNDRQNFLLVQLGHHNPNDPDQLYVKAYSQQQSHRVHLLHWATGLISIPEKTSIKIGESISYYPFDLFFN